MKVYGDLIRKYVDDLKYTGWFMPIEHLEVAKQQYQTKMDRLYKRLEREYGFDKEKFYSLQEQAMMF